MALRELLETEKFLTRDSHFVMRIDLCPRCGQPYLYTMAEQIGIYGEDPVYRTYLRIGMPTRHWLLSQPEQYWDGPQVTALGLKGRQWKYDHPAMGGPYVWDTAGPLEIAPHD